MAIMPILTADAPRMMQIRVSILEYADGVGIVKPAARSIRSII